MDPTAPEVIALARRWLCEEYPAKIRRALETLPDAEIWWRPNPASNSVGNLVLHLCGNVRQWVVAGIGGAEDVRERAKEFDAEGGADAATLRARLDETVVEVAATLDALDPDRLDDRLEIQGLRVSVLEALLHAVEHFSMHTGQILWIAKARTGRDLGFYRLDDAGRVVDTDW